MKINKASKDTVSVKSLIKNNFHYAHLLSLSGNDSDISEIITILTDLGFSEKKAWDIFREVYEQSEVGTLYPVKVTLLPPFFWLNQAKKEKHLHDLMEADKLMQSKAIYVYSPDFDFSEILLESNNDLTQNKEWYVIY